MGCGFTRSPFYAGAGIFLKVRAGVVFCINFPTLI